MAAPHRQSIESERPNSLHDVVQRDGQAYNGYIEDDIHGIYGLEDILVSDGFRPPHAAQNHDRIASLPSTSIDFDPANIPLPSSPPPRPTSAIKPVRIDDFALRHDGRMGPLNSESTPDESSEAPSLSRTTSMTSDGPILIPEGPYVGPTRPSHAYHMYGQSTRPQRAASVATTSSFNMPLERTYTGPSGPAHPYTLYPQNTVPEVDDTSIVNANIPIGFNNLAGQQYQRRLGPDGEDAADLIGPHGHTEELPPYTKYPDEAYTRKMMQNSAPSERAPFERAPSIQSGGVRESVDIGAGGIGLATRNPEFSSNEELAPRPPSTQPSSESTRLSAVSTHSGAPVAIPNPELSEKPSEIIDPRWKRRARKKVGGLVPVWALCLAISVVVSVALLLGVTLGIVLNKKDEDRARELDTSFDSHGGYAGFSETGKYITTVTTTIDASPLPSMPSDLPDLPVGNFSLVIPPAMPTRNQCLSHLDHLSSWSCAMPAITLQMSITNLGSYSPKTHNKAIYITPQEDTGTSWSYGTQPPRIDGTQPARLVDDLDDSEYGPAWFFQVSYQKLVVLQESTFSTSLATLDIEADLTPETPTGSTVVPDGKRAVTEKPVSEKDKRATDRIRKGVAQPGDKPWFCYWNGTLLEVFIYPNTTSDAGDAQIEASRSSASAAKATQPTTSSHRTSGMPVWPRYHRYSAETASVTHFLASPTVVGAAVVDPSPIGAPSSSASEPIAVQTGWPLYPRVVKLEERRMPRMPGFDQPFCKQKLIGPDGMQATDVVNGDGHGTSIVLSEKLVSQARRKRREEPWNAQGAEGLDELEAATKKTEDSGGNGLRKRDLDGECHCIWMVE